VRPAADVAELSRRRRLLVVMRLVLLAGRRRRRRVQSVDRRVPEALLEVVEDVTGLYSILISTV